MSPRVLIIDYGLGNLFSVQRALNYIGVSAIIIKTPEEILKAERLILPGVGAFGNGMAGLREGGFIEPIKRYVAIGKPLLGICLGMQLLMSEGDEFGMHKGLDIINGKVVNLKPIRNNKDFFKVPHVGWNRLFFPAKHKNDDVKTSWTNTILEDVKESEFVYFVHSNVVIPHNLYLPLAETMYGESKFCSVIQKENVYGCQFHPERSGDIGLKILKKFVLL